MSNKISFVISDVTSKGGTERMTTLLSTLLSEQSLLYSTTLG